MHAFELTSPSILTKIIFSPNISWRTEDFKVKCCFLFLNNTESFNSASQLSVVVSVTGDVNVILIVTGDDEIIVDAVDAVKAFLFEQFCIDCRNEGK